MNLLGKIDHQFNGSDHFSVRYSLYDVDSSNSRGAGGLNAPSASAALNNRDQTIAFSNTLTLSPRTVNETRAQFAYSDLLAPPTDPVGPSVNIAGVAVIRHAVEQPDRPPEQDVSGRQQPVAPGRGARAACRRRLSLQRRPHHLSARRSRRVHVLVARELPQRYLQQCRVHADLRRERRRSRQRECRHVRAGRVARQLEPDAESRPALRPPVPADNQHRHRTTSRRVPASRGRRLPRATRSCAAAPGSSTIACRCARWRMRCSRPATPPISQACGRLASACRRRRPGRRSFRTSFPVSCPRSRSSI